MSMLNGITGRFGEPEGAFKRFGKKELEDLITSIVNHQIEINIFNITNNLTPVAWARVKADGTIVVDEGFTSCTRTGVGVYSLVTDITVGTSGSEPLSAVLVTPSSASGQGGNGLIPIKEFSDYDVVATDSYSNSSDWFWYPDSNTLGKIAVLGVDADDIFIHNLDSFTTAATQDTTSTIRTTGLSGCIDKDRLRIWLSGDSGYAVRAFDLASRTYTTFEVGDRVCVAANDTMLITYEGGNTYAYTYNYGGATLGGAPTPTNTWGVSTYTSIGSVGVWHPDGSIWWPGSAGLIRIDPTINTTYRTYAYPSSPSGLGPHSQLMYDELRDLFYVSLVDVGGKHYLYRFSGWSTTENNVATWEQWIGGTSAQFIGVWHDPVSDIIFVADYGLLYAYRYYASTGQIIDVVQVNAGLTPTADIDYDITNSRWAYYSDGIGYVMATKSSVMYLVRIIYDGAEITTTTGGGGKVTSVLIAHGTVVAANTVKAELFRSMSPPQRADGQFNIAVFGKV